MSLVRQARMATGHPHSPAGTGKADLGLCNLHSTLPVGPRWGTTKFHFAAQICLRFFNLYFLKDLLYTYLDIYFFLIR